MSGSAPDDSSDDLTEKLLDLLVYAPIGLILDVQTLTPDLARRGRQHTAAARQLGEMAVKRGLRRLDDTASNRATSTAAEEPARADAATKKATATKKRTGKKTGQSKRTAKKPTTTEQQPRATDAARPGNEAPDKSATTPSDSAAAAADRVVPAVGSLAIPDYDLLAASQVVKRLDALTADELEAVRDYESGTRDRRTILHKIARLQA